MVRILKIEQRDLFKTPESQMDETEFEITLKFTTQDLQWGWPGRIASVIRPAVQAIAPTHYVA
jgi:hypothetical protein